MLRLRGGHSPAKLAHLQQPLRRQELYEHDVAYVNRVGATLADSPTQDHSRRYPLVMSNTAMENHYVQWKKNMINGDFP